MSGHSKWHKIKHAKGAADAKRGQISTRHANLIAIAAQKGGDPAMNPALRLTIENAKKDNIPNSNIERAIRRGTGESKEGAAISELMYEGYGPSGIAFIVECVTDNKNRTYSNLRTIIDKKGGNIGSTGSVAWMFNKKGVMDVNIAGKNVEEMELLAIDAGAEDVSSDAGMMEVYVPLSMLHEAKTALEKQCLTVEKAETKWVPKNIVKIESPEAAKKVIEFMEAIEEDADVSNVASNFDIPEELLRELPE